MLRQRPPSELACAPPHMSLLDAEHSVLSSPNPRKNGSFPSISLTSSHIQEALARSNDGGVTLVLMKKNFADIGSDAAEELATIGREFPEDECRVQRCVYRELRYFCVVNDWRQDIAGTQPANHSTDGIRPALAFEVFESEEQLLLCVSGRGVYSDFSILCQ